MESPADFAPWGMRGCPSQVVTESGGLTTSQCLDKPRAHDATSTCLRSACAFSCARVMQHPMNSNAAVGADRGTCWVHFLRPERVCNSGSDRGRWADILYKSCNPNSRTPDAEHTKCKGEGAERRGSRTGRHTGPRAGTKRIARINMAISIANQLCPSICSNGHTRITLAPGLGTHAQGLE